MAMHNHFLDTEDDTEDGDADYSNNDDPTTGTDFFPRNVFFAHRVMEVSV